MIARLAIVGVGLLGGSVARAARSLGVAREIVGVARNPTRVAGAVEDGVLDRLTADLADGVRDADLVVLGAPVQAIERMLEPVWRVVGPDTVVTDVGSTKATIVRAARRLEAIRPWQFVGSHPMAGSERSGYAASRADLFRGATVVVTPEETTGPAAVKRVTGFWEALGAGRVLTLAPEAHDRAVAAISHLPHLVACALVAGAERFEPLALDVAARGFRDTTRIAAGDPAVWREIFLDNHVALLEAVAVFREVLSDLERAIGGGDGPALEAALAGIKARREALT